MNTSPSAVTEPVSRPAEKSVVAKPTKAPEASQAADTTTEKRPKPGRKPKLATISTVRYFAGELKNGTPVVSSEYSSESAAKIGSLASGKAFFVIEAYLVKITGVDPSDGNKFDFELIPVNSEQQGS